MKENLRIQQGIETKNSILDRASKLFASRGFSGTRFDLIAKDLGMTAGVMYHHFSDKRDLFEAVVRRAQQEIAQKVVQDAEKNSNVLDGIVAGCMRFIKEVISQKYCQIVLIDSISSLGWEKWKAIDSEFSERSLVKAIEEAKSKRLIRSSLPAPALARFISGGTNDLALWVRANGGSAKAFREAERVLSHIVNELGGKPNKEDL